MEGCDDARPIVLVTNVVMPDHLAIRRVQERNAEITPRTTVDAAAVPLRLRQHILRTKRQLLRLDHTNHTTTENQRVVRGPTRRRILLDGTAIKTRQWHALLVWCHTPVGSAQPLIDERLARQPLRVRRTRLPHRAISQKTQEVSSGLKTKYIPPRQSTSDKKTPLCGFGQYLATTQGSARPRFTRCRYSCSPRRQLFTNSLRRAQASFLIVSLRAGVACVLRQQSGSGGGLMMAPKDMRSCHGQRMVSIISGNHTRCASPAAISEPL